MTDIIGKSFIGTLECATPEGVGSIDYLRSIDLAGSGWLVQGAQTGVPLLLRFDFIEQVEDRLHYTISAAPGTGSYAGAKLGVSRNGYLGFYEVAAVTNYWKIEVLEHQDEPGYFEFTLRDYRGYRVAAVREQQGSFAFGLDQNVLKQVHFLNVEKGKIARFGAFITEFV